MNGLFFDPRRYDLSRVGRYKYNKNWPGGPPVPGSLPAGGHPTTGEAVMAEAENGATVTKEMADAVAVAGVMGRGTGEEVKVISNGMVDIQTYVGFDAKAECGINEKVCFSVLPRSWSPPRVRTS